MEGVLLGSAQRQWLTLEVPTGIRKCIRSFPLTTSVLLPCPQPLPNPAPRGWPCPLPAARRPQYGGRAGRAGGSGTGSRPRLDALSRAHGGREALFRMCHDVEENIRVPLDAEIEPPVPCHPRLPDIPGLVVFLGT